MLRRSRRSLADVAPVARGVGPLRGRARGLKPVTDRDRRSNRIVLVLAALNLGLFAAFLALRLTQPSDGMRLQPGTQAIEPQAVVLSSLGPATGALQGGDRVTAIDGRPVNDWAGALLCWAPLCDGPERPRWQFGDSVTYTILREGRTIEAVVALGRYPLAANLRQDWGALLYALALFLTGALVFYRRPEQTATRLLFLAGSSMLGATTWSLGLQALDFVQPLPFWLHRVTTHGVYLVLWSATLHFALVFPNPHRLLRRHGWLVPTLYALPFLVHIAAVIGTGLAAAGPLDWLARLGLDQNLTVTIYLVLSVLALATNYRDQPDLTGRQQIRVVVHSAALIVGVGVLLWQLPEMLLGEQRMTSSMMAVIGLLLPLSLVASILRYRLWDIDVLINRTAVYGSLSIAILVLYVSVAGALGALFQQRGSSLFSLVAAALVAVAFQPLREGLQRAVNRLMYGERDDPYRVLSRLGKQLQSAALPEELLETMTQTVASALKLPYAGIAIREDGEFKTQAEYGVPAAEAVTLPLVYQREVVGRLAVAPRSPREPLGPADMSLLESIAQQAGAVVHSARLYRDLQRSRERLVTAREEERRRLRRDLHDGLGPTLASHTLRLDAILDLVDSDPARARQQIEDLRSQTKDTVAEIRRLVYELRPPALDDLGLIEALRTHLLQLRSTHQRTDITLDVPPEGLPALTAAVEVAAYRIIMEGLTNVLRHAGAACCRVRLSVEAGARRELRIEILDDGKGLPERVEAGVGVLSMHERAVELGGSCTLEEAADGGTRLRARLPLGATGDQT